MKTYLITTFKQTHVIKADSYKDTYEKLHVLEEHPVVKFVRFCGIVSVVNVGKTFITEFYVTKCECGRAVIQKCYILVDESRDITKKEQIERRKEQLMIGVCPCGNVYLTSKND